MQNCNPEIDGRIEAALLNTLFPEHDFRVVRLRNGYIIEEFDRQVYLGHAIKHTN